MDWLLSSQRAGPQALRAAALQWCSGGRRHCITPARLSGTRGAGPNWDDNLDGVDGAPSVSPKGSRSFHWDILALSSLLPCVRMHAGSIGNKVRAFFPIPSLSHLTPRAPFRSSDYRMDGMDAAPGRACPDLHARRNTV